MRVEVCRRHTSHTHAEVLQMVGAERGIHRSEIELALILVRRGRDITGDQYLGGLDDHVESRYLAKLRQQVVQGALFLFQGDMAVVYPEGVAAVPGGGFGQLMDRAEKTEDRVGVLHVELILIEIP